ncbi:phage tail tape measure protein [Gottfriedia sp. NPDC057948]|uniref:phage tail tape measure protein n=1 Tax=Gottfriedia sp. NPDC057948 TaxID=3346287 RepID=UPI0036D82E02
MSFNLVAQLSLRDNGFTRNMRNANRLMGSAKSGAGAFAKQLGLITSVAAGVGVAFSSLNKAMDFQSQMSTIKALTGMSKDQLAEMQKLALDAGKATKYSALESAKAIEELAKAGMSTDVIKNGGLLASLNAATAGGMELADAAALMANSMNGFKKDGLSAAKTADILAGAANASASSMMDLKYGLAAVGPVASGLGMSFRDTNAALALFTNNNMSGSDAGTSFKTMLMNLIPSTKKAREEMMDLGMITKDGANQFFDAKGKIKDLAGVTDVLHQALKDLNPEQRSDELKTLFGSDAIRAGTILFEEGAAGVKKMYDEMSKVTALDVAKEKMNNAQGAIEQFKGAMETLQISVLLPLLPTIKKAANNAATFVSNLKPETIQQWGQNIKNAGEKLYNFAKFVYDNWQPIKEAFIALSVGIIAAKVAMIGLDIAMMSNPIGLIITAVFACAAAWVYLIRNWDSVKAKALEVWGVLRGFLGPIGTLIEAAVRLALNWDNTWSSIQRSAATAVNGVIGKINSLIRTINLIPGVNVPIIPRVEWGNTKAGSYVSGGMQSSSHITRKSHHSGLSNVPYDGYAANLHRGERILTAVENEEYKKNKGGKGGNVNLTINYQATGHTEQDAKNLMHTMARLLEKEGAWA